MSCEADLGPYGLLPSSAGAQWVHGRVLDESLVRADSAKLYFDPASDTVYLSATNVHLPNAVTVHVGPDGNQVTITPTPPALVIHGILPLPAP
ncbi:hypothetical protein [Streptomyces sp. NBC_00316]|uniref:hypothetical protein n=1 Tax=Streptomyces sp. NBC_00316 TaxID=2975710 RepID=UPI002E2C3A1A|nr:hypothetical protein [Streptomyces sp. NBC_00316]